MKPRGFWGTFIIQIIISVVIVPPLSFALYLIWGSEFVQIIMWCSILFGLLSFATAFELKKVVISVTFQDKEAFLKRLNAELEEMDYHQESQTEASLTYKTSFMHGHGFYAPKIYVQIDQSSATIVGPSGSIKKLQGKIKAVAISQTFQDKEAFLKRLNAELEEMGYHLQSQTEVSLTYKPSFMHGHGFFAPKLYVQVEQSSATIVGPSRSIKKLQRKIGVQ